MQTSNITVLFQSLADLEQRWHTEVMDRKQWGKDTENKATSLDPPFFHDYHMHEVCLLSLYQVFLLYYISGYFCLDFIMSSNLKGLPGASSNPIFRPFVSLSNPPKCRPTYKQSAIHWWFVKPGSDNPEISLIRTKSAGTDFRFWTDNHWLAIQ